MLPPPHLLGLYYSLLGCRGKLAGDCQVHREGGHQPTPAHTQLFPSGLIGIWVFWVGPDVVICFGTNALQASENQFN